MTIEDCRLLALRNNLDIRVALYNPTISKTQISAAQAQYELAFVGSVNYSNSNSATASQLANGQSKNLGYSAGLKANTLSGGAVQGTLPLDEFSTNNSFSTLNPSYSVNPSFTISQNLLRGFGPDATLAGIRIAFYGYQRSLATTKLSVIQALANVDRAYWQLAAINEAVSVRKEELELAQKQLDRARRQVAAGTAAEVEVIRAESGVAERVTAVITSENNQHKQERRLKVLLNDASLPLDGKTRIIPTTPPRTLYVRLDRDKLLDIALRERMEMIELELNLLSDDVSIRQARNGLLPLVNLTYTYRINGLGQGYPSAFGQVGNNDFADHVFGANLEIPIGNGAARATLRSALAGRLQLLATKDGQILTIKEELFNAIDNLDSSRQNIGATAATVSAAQRTYDAEVRQFERGLRTSTDVLQAQSTLANAKLSQIQATSDYQISQIDVAFASGNLLGASQVNWAPMADPKVPLY